MQFAPKTEKEVAEANLLPAGPYPFTVQSADEKTSKAGNPMIALKLEVYDEDGKGRHLLDWIMEAVPHKLRHFAYAVGLGARYEAGTLGAAELQGLTGICQVKIEAAKDGYNAKNSVKDYVPAGEKAKPAPQVPGPAPANDPGSPPF